MTEHDALVGFRLRLFTLAEELGNVSAACRAMGVDRSSYDRWKAKVDRWGMEALRVPRASAAADAQPDRSAGRHLQQVTTDNGWEFRAEAFGAAVERLGAHQRSHPRRAPNSNGCVERAQLTILEECWRPAFARSLIPKSTALPHGLAEYLDEYNHDRAHTGRLTKDARPQTSSTAHAK